MGFLFYLGIPLEFVRPLNNVELTEVPIEPVVLECELSRAPGEKVQWLKNDKPLVRIPDHVRVEEDKNGTVHRIVFKRLEEEDLATYRIEVGKLSSEAHVEMKGKRLIVVVYAIFECE
jgi:hypothetical protein